MTNNPPTESKADILIVDDTPENLRLLNQILSQHYKVRLAPSGTIGLVAAHSIPPDLILLDIMMPGMNGYEVAAQLKADRLTRDIPIVFMSALDDTESKVRGFQAGGIDYVTKPFQEMEVLARVRTHISNRSLYKQAQVEIVERRRAEGDLRESESRLQALLSAVPDTMYRIRRDGVFLDFKTSSNELLFAPPDQVVGASLKNLLEEPLANQFIDCIEHVLDSKEMQTMEYKLKRDDSSRIFEARFKDSGTNEVTVIIRDISAWARLEQMKSDFINRASHELRTPIATMLLMINLIESDPTPDEYRQYWDVLKTEIHNEHMLVENLLNVGRMESGQIRLHFGAVNLNKLLNKVMDQFAIPAREKNISLTLQASLAPGRDAVAQADETALNLLLKEKAPGFEVSVSDSGMGILSEDLPLLFTRFFRGSNAIENEIPGTGIGLFIVKSIVDRHNGSIRAHSEAGKGSRFDVWLPLQQPGQ